MKNNILLTMALLAAIVIAGYAGDITDTGIYQKDLHTFLSNVVTMNNEVKTDYNTLTLHIASMTLLVNELRTAVTTATTTVNVAAVSSGSAVIPTVSTTNLSLTGL